VGVKAFTYRRVKNDEKDAADLADLLRMGRLPEAWIAPAEIRELRELTRYRLKLVQRRSGCKDQVHAVLAKLGVPVTCTDIFGVWGNTWLDGLALPQPYAGKAASLRKLIAAAGHRDHPAGHGDRRSAGRPRRSPRHPGAAGYRPGAGRGHRG
jgi:hypothetical protein